MSGRDPDSLDPGGDGSSLVPGVLIPLLGALAALALAALIGLVDPAPPPAPAAPVHAPAPAARSGAA